MGCLRINGKDKPQLVGAILLAVSRSGMASDGRCVPGRWHQLHQELVKQGACWWYRKYAPGDTVLEGLEKDAREARIGLWHDLQPIPPWQWRKR